mmetsp:Transcript_45174/g.118573  ORF Transcript_45174/g.118573 Transcript_45174/m.118573 type:complete len:143 (-) Transcript_45174:444-872(-)
MKAHASGSYMCMHPVWLRRVCSKSPQTLKSLASQHRQRLQRDRQEERSRESWTRHWLENFLAAFETLSRGFMLGFGLSFIYETLLLNRDFYVEVEKLTPRITRAAFRASALGVAVAVTMHGSAIVIPHSWRSSWMDGLKAHC